MYGMPLYGQPPMGGYVLQGMGGGYMPAQQQVPAFGGNGGKMNARQVANEAAMKISRQFKRYTLAKKAKQLSALNPRRLNSVDEGREDEEHDSPKSEKMVFNSHLATAGGSASSSASRSTNNKASAMGVSRDSTTEEN